MSELTPEQKLIRAAIPFIDELEHSILPCYSLAMTRENLKCVIKSNSVLMNGFYVNKDHVKIQKILDQMQLVKDLKAKSLIDLRFKTNILINKIKKSINENSIFFTI